VNKRREAIAGYLFASPWFVGMAVFLLYPLLASIYYSFCDYSVLKPPVWIGAANYAEIAKDEVFWKTVTNTAIYAAMVLPVSMMVALGLAMLLNSKVKGMAFYRTIFFLPALVPMISLAVLWLWILNSEYGVLNQFLGFAHLKQPNWLGDPSWAKPALVITSVWGVGNAMLIYLASLQDVPASLLEASDLDGANGWQKTKNVTLPMISPVILFNLVMGIIGTLQVFAVPYVMLPNGGPERSGYFYTAYLFDNAFRFNKMGYACAMGWIMFIVSLVLTFASLKLSEKHVHYQGS
jgi:multiple sugar transport system permease protein